MTTKKKKVAFTTGHGEADTNQGFQALKGDLEQEFEVTTVNPSPAEIGKDVDALVVGGPKQAFDEKGQREIDKFLMEGKGVVFLVDGMAMQAPGGMGGQMPADAAEDGPGQRARGLGKLLEAYGFKVEPGLRVRPPERARPDRHGSGRPMLANLPFFVAAEIAGATRTSPCSPACAAWSSPSPPASSWWARSRAASRPGASCGRWPPRPRRAGSTPASSCSARAPRSRPAKDRGVATPWATPTRAR